MNKLLEHHRRMSLKVDYKGNGERKPLYSYAALICLAMRDAGKKMTLSQIYRWIRDNFAYYRTGDKSWQVRRGVVGGVGQVGLNLNAPPVALDFHQKWG